MAGTLAQIMVPRDVYEAAQNIADERGDVLRSFVREAIVSAAVAAQAGFGHRLPRKPRRAAADPDSRRFPVRYKTAEDERGGCWAAINGAGSSPPAVTVFALEAYAAAGGRRLDIRLPWAVPPVNAVRECAGAA